jgi:ADP-ribose pyrophosphatase YjhB (NUDIX family)
LDRLHRLALRIAWLGLRVYWRLFHPEVRGTAVLVRVDDRLLVIRNSYRKVLTIPGGRVGRHEEHRSAAARELEEETGISVEAERLVPVGHVLCTALGSKDDVHFYELRLEREPTVHVDGREVVEARFADEASLDRQTLWPPLRQLFDEADG